MTTTITINALNPLTTYEFRVCAINELGASPFSDPLIITTEMEGKLLIYIFLFHLNQTTTKVPPILIKKRRIAQFDFD